jgi:SAM-dependent methyltransferase
MTTREHWDGTWSAPVRLRVPSPLWVGIRDLHRLLRVYVKSGSSVLEVGCAPGKTLAWVARSLGARVAGLDYSPRGLEFARALLRRCGVVGDLRCEDIFATTFAPGTFDVVFSVGVIEHFEDPREIVRRHVLLAKPGGLALIMIPNYGGVYGRLQRRFDPGNLAIHNLAIMSPGALKALAPLELVGMVDAYPAGRLSPWLISFERRWPHPVALGVCLVLNGVGLLQPLDVTHLCPTLVLALRRLARVPA